MAVFNNFHNEQILKLDVKQQQPNKIPRFVQYDSALLKIELYDNGKLYDVSRADEFVISAKRPDGSKVSGLAEYDGEFVTYKLSKQDLEMLGETSARLQIYEGRNRLSSLSFRYDVYEDYEAVGNPDDVTLLSALLSQVRDALAEAQRQGGYAENRGDFANSAGDYANKAGDSQKMRWLKWVKTVAERNSKYKNPRNGDTVYVVNVADKNGGAVYRYNAIERPHKWEEISGWDTSIIQDIYNMLGDLEDKKETKAKVAQLVKQLQEDLANTRIGANNIIKQTDTSIASNDVLYAPVTSNSEVSVINTTTGHGRVVQARLPANTNQSYYGATVGNSASKRFSVQEGETLTLSFLGAKSLTATDFTYVYLMRTDGTNKAMTLLRKHDLDASSYDKYEFTVTAPWSSDNAYLLIGSNKRSEYGDDNAFWIRFKDVSLVRGNRAADWAPSFDDLVKNAQDLVKEVRDELNGTITKHNSRISVLEDKIKMTVTETTYDSKMKQIAQWQSEYEQTARDITTTVSKKVGNNEIISRINQSAESVSISASKINLSGYVTIGKLENGTQKVHPNAMKNFGMTTIDGGTLTIDKLNIRREDGNFHMIEGKQVAEYSAQRYEPDFSTAHPLEPNGRVWNPEGTFYTAPLVAVYGQNGYDAWKSDKRFDGYPNTRLSDNYTNVQAYRVVQTARYLVVRYGVLTNSAGILVRVAESSTTGSNLKVSRTHKYLDEDSGYGGGGEFNMVLDLESRGSRFGKGRLFYVRATSNGADRALGASALRKMKIRLLGVYLTDTPPVGNEQII